MRRTLCLILALCLFPFAGFAEGEAQPSDVHSVWQQFRSAVQETDAAEAAASPTPVPSGDVSESEEEKLPMDAFDFLDRYLFALNMLGLNHLGYNCTYALNPEDNEAYLVMDHLLLTLSWDRTRLNSSDTLPPPVQRVTHVDCFYKDEEGIAPMVSALVFAASGEDKWEERTNFSYGLTELSKYQDQESAQALIHSLTSPVPVGDYLAWDDESCFSLIFNDPDLHPVSRFYSRTDLEPYETDGVNLYEFVVKYTYASQQYPKTSPFLTLYPKGKVFLPTYRLDAYAKIVPDYPTFEITYFVYNQRESWLKSSSSPIKMAELISMLFALSDRTIEEELAASPEERFLPASADAKVLAEAILKILKPQKVGHYGVSDLLLNEFSCSFTMHLIWR